MSDTGQPGIVVVACPREGTYINLATCRACMFFKIGIACPIHRRTVPIEICEKCLAVDPCRACSMAAVHNGVCALEDIKDQVAMCGYPRVCRVSHYQEMPESELVDLCKDAEEKTDE